MFEPFDEETDPRAPLREGDEEEGIEQHAGSDPGAGGQKDEGAPPPP